MTRTEGADVRRFVRITAGAAAFGLAGALALNIAAIIRVPVGPLGTSDEPGAGHQMSIVPQDTQDEVFTTVILTNAWPMAATIEAVRPILRTEHGGAEIVGAQPYDWTTLSEDQQLILGSVLERPDEWAGDHPITGTQVAAAADATGAVALVRVWIEPGSTTDVAGYEIDYRVGPLAFHAISTTNSIVVCGKDGVVPDECGDAEEAASATGSSLSGTNE